MAQYPTIFYRLVRILCIACVCKGEASDGTPVGSNTNSMDRCSTESETLRAIPEIQRELTEITTQFHATATNLERLCITTPTEHNCQVDYSTFQNSLQQACESNGGVYLEKEHRIVCPTSQRNTVMHVTNFPLCFGIDCTDADIERIVAEEVHELAQDLSTSFETTCSTEYDINNGKCASPVNASPRTCGPLEEKTNGVLCECYTFCNGELVACEGNDTPPSFNACEGDLVSGCNFVLFGEYDVDKSSGSTITFVTVTMAALQAASFFQWMG